MKLPASLGYGLLGRYSFRNKNTSGIKTLATFSPKLAEINTS